MHSSDKEYYCHECDEHFKGPSYFKHLKSRRHYANYVKHHFDSAPDWEPDCDDSPLETLSMDTRDPKAREHALNFMRSLPQFLDMWYSEYHLHVSSTRSGIRLVISLSKMDYK